MLFRTLRPSIWSCCQYGAVAKDVHEDDAVLNEVVKVVKGIEVKDTVPDMIAHDQREDYPLQTGMFLCSNPGEHLRSAGEDFQASGKQGRPPDVPQEGQPYLHKIGCPGVLGHQKVFNFAESFNKIVVLAIF